MKKYIITLLLLLSFGTPFLGTYYFLLHQKQKRKIEFKKKISNSENKNNLVHFKFCKTDAKTQLDWEHENEFEYKGEMYDVVKSATINDSLNYWCLYDHDETELNELLKKLVTENFGDNPKNKEKHKLLCNYFKSLYFIPLYHYPFFKKNQLELNRYYTFRYSSLNLIPAVPPPEIT